MPKFGKRSKVQFETLSNYAQIVLHEAIKVYDFTILYGHRTPEEQFKLFKKGRILNSLGKWVIFNKKKVVTYCDGYNKVSDHNINPSPAFDIAPYPIDWKNIYRFYELAGIIKATAFSLNIRVQWGGDWKRLKDFPHYKIIGGN